MSEEPQPGSRRRPSTATRSLLIGTCLVLVLRSASAAADVDASPLGQAVELLTSDAGIATMLIGAADQTVSSQSTPTTTDSTKTQGGVREVFHVTHTTAYRITFGHVAADVTIVTITTRTDAATGALIDRKTSDGQAHFDIAACPDENGLAAGSASLAFQADTRRADGRESGGVASASGAVRYYNGDDAHLTRTETDVEETADIHGFDGSTPFQSAVSRTISMSTPVSGSITVSNVATRSESGDTTRYPPQQSIGFVSLLHLLLVHEIGEETEKFWRSGKCINLKASEKSRRVAPHEKITFTVDGIDRVDSKTVKDKIRGDLTGTKSLDPDGKEIAPTATFDFVAGGEKGDHGSIALQQVGKRGIGKATLDFTVDCASILVSASGSFTLRSIGPSFDGQLTLPATALTCQEDGTYRAVGEMHVRGTKIGEVEVEGVHSTCTTRYDYDHPVDVVARPDETDLAVVRVRVTPQIANSGAQENCVITAAIEGRLIRREVTRPHDDVIGLELWGRMMSNRETRSGQPTTIDASIAQGGARSHTVTTLSVVVPDAPP